MTIRTRTTRFGLMLSAASFAVAAAHAAAPPAGSKIGNQASATYTNASGDTISVTSNKVETIVQQVAGLTLLTDNTESAAPGGFVFMPHTLTNEGNGTDSFALTATEDPGGLNFTHIKIFADANFDGIADSTTPITATPVLAAGEAFGFVIEALVPGGATSGQSETIEVDAVSAFDGNVLTTPTGSPGVKTNVDTITISTGPITEIVKSMTVAEGPGAAADGITGPGDIVTVVLTYSSTGLTAADMLVVTDPLSQYLDYDTATPAIWSDSASNLTDSSNGFEQTNGNGQQIDYSYDSTATATVSGTVSFTVDQVPTGRTGTVTFKAIIADDAPAGDIPNIATQTVELTPGNPTSFPPSNEAIVTVDPLYRVTAADAPASSYAADPDTGGASGNLLGTGVSATDDDGLQNDIVTESSNAYQGSAITFEYVITNHANTADTIDLSVANGVTNGFPTGTTFQLVGADGATPIVGPLGPIASGASATVNVIATLPPSATPTAAGATNYEVVLTAQSANGGPTNTATGLFTGAVLGATVDLENSDTSGNGADPAGSPVHITQTTNPGDPVIFPMVVQNGGPTADTYDLSLPTPLPPGWTVSFELPDGTPISNTGVIPGGGSQDIVVIVTPPANELPGDTPFQVAIQSPTSGQGDTLTNQVTVNEIVDASLVTNQSVQVAPGGVVDIPHTLTNEGNIDITEGGLAASGTFSSFSGTIFWDVNDDGALDAGDVVVDNIADITGGLPVGGSISLIHRVQVPSNGAIGLSEAETLTLETALNAPTETGTGTKTDSDPSNNTVTDTVVVVSGDMALTKKQALDAACDGGEPASAFTAGDIDAKPGECIRYEITANNTGTANASTVTIQDTVPGFTTLTECLPTGGGAAQCAVVVTPAGSTVTQPAEGSGGSLQSAHGTLIPGAPATLSFTVKIDE